MSVSPIIGKITNILDRYTVVINLGTEKDITAGMKFEILGPAVAVKDPDSGSELGKIEYVKARVKIVRIHPKYSIAESYEQILERSLPFPSFTVGSTMTKELPVDPSRIEVGAQEVRVGDTVRQIVDTAKR